MKANYKKWVPKGMIWALAAANVLTLALFLIVGVSGISVHGTCRIVLGILFGAAFIVCLKHLLEHSRLPRLFI